LRFTTEAYAWSTLSKHHERFDDGLGCSLAQVVGVSSREVVLNAGNIHCITQQQPAGW
jgi:hypothetical protein